jgi:hypothetical protein
VQTNEDNIQKILDNEGVDMTNQLLSLKKKKPTLGKDDHFDNTFDIREFFTRRKFQRLQSEFKHGKQDHKQNRHGSRLK